jgi:TetR/AcrR family transcriptional repressor of nem operon
VCALLASELPALPEAVAHEVRAYFRCLSAWLTSLLDLGIRKGELSLHYPAGVEAEVLMATVHGAMLSARAYGEGSVFASIVNPQLERMLAKS